MDAATSEAMVLGLLAESGTEFVPGEVLCGKLGLEPAEVFRHVNRLRAKGYRIDALGRRGYRLVSVPDRLGPLEVDTFLTTHDLGRAIHHRASVASTNDVAMRLGREGAFHGETVIAEEQTQGRGRRGRVWDSPKGRNLYCSVILRPDLPASRAPELPLLAAVALAQTLREAFGLAVTIKWPNDLLLEGRKIAGLLSELETKEGRIGFVVLGLGVNINTPREAWPEPLREVAISVRDALGEPVDRSLLVAAILGRLEDWYDRWIEEGFGPVREAWRELSSTLGTQVRVDLGAGPALLGTAEDLDASGALLVRREDGVVERVMAGDVTSLRPE